MSIIVKDITKLYGKQKALDAVSFEIKTGEIVGFLGPNGAGKSTMMKILTCFLPQTSGKASVYGFDIEEQSIEVRRNIGYLPEHNPLYHDMYVKEYLEFICGLHHLDKVPSRIANMIEKTGLQVEQKKKIGALSKGYRQRVGLAQALIHDPKVLILDEPTTGLDPNQLAEIRSLITEIGKEKTVMLSTHIMQEVEAICSRVIIVNKGKIVADDITANIQKGSSTQQIITVEFDKATSSEVLLSLAGIESAVPGTSPFTWKLISALERDLRPDIFHLAVQNGLAVLAMQKEEQKLEDVFKQLTK
jgi:ABC-2 type transport system ATP-binding protein